MKRFKDLTNEEIYHLEEEEIKYWVDLECAFSDKPLPPPRLGEKPKKPEIQPDLELYALGLYPSYYVKTEKEAAVILEAMKTVNLWRVEYKDSIKIAKKYDDDAYCQMAIQPIRLYSQEMYDVHKVTLKQYEMDAKAYEEQKTAYDKAQAHTILSLMEERSDIVDWIYGEIERVRELYKKREKYRDAYNEYLKLSRGDVTIALTFFSRSYPDWKDEDLGLDDLVCIGM